MNEKNYSCVTSIRKLFPLLLMLLFVNLSWGQYSGSGTFNKITSISDLTDGYYVIVNSGNTFAMNNTHNGTYFANTSVSFSNDAISNPSMGLVWKIETNGTGRTIYNEGSNVYVSYTGSSNSVQSVSSVSSNNQRWNITYGTNEFIFTNVAVTSRILKYNSGSPRFACYTTGQQNLLLYKLASPANTVPTVSNVEISGLPTTGAELAGSYDYADAESDVDASTFKWYTAADASGTDATSIADATSQNFTLTNAELGKYIRFGVQAASATGTSPGVEVFSSWVGPVTAAGTPVLNAGLMAAFADTCLNQTTASNSFSLMGSNLSGNVTVGSLSGFAYSLVENGTYTSTLTITPVSESIDTVVYVRFTPTVAQSYNGTIVVSGGGAASENVSVMAEGINTAVVVTTGTSSNLTAFTATVAGSLLQGCSTISAYGIEYSATENFANGTGTVVASDNIEAGAFSVDLAGLNSFTTYYYKAFATDATGTVYGSQNSFTTNAVSAPTALEATGTGMNSFTAHWEAVEGVSTYELDVYEVTPGVNISDLIISEYIEGSSNNKAIEIYNGTGATVDLSAYSLRKQNNGVGVFGSALELSGSLANGSTYVIVNSSANTTLKSYANLQTGSGALTFNGNDAVALYKGEVQIDMVGVVDGTSNWGANVTLVRNANAAVPKVAYSIADWNTLAEDTFTNLGGHVYGGGSSSVLVLENQLVENETSFVVSGLNPATEYFYVVRAKDANSTSTNSNEVAVTTADAVTVFEDGVWSNGVPTAALDAVILSNFTTTENLEAKSLTITSGQFTVASGTVLTVVESITNNAGANAFVVENNGIVLQTSDAVNTALATVKVNSANLYRQDYTLWSSPVSGQNLRSFSPQTLYNRFSSYDTALGTAGDYVQEIVTTADMNTKTFVNAKGYLIRMPNNWTQYVNTSIPGTPFLGAFVGTLNNGTVSIGLSQANTKLNLVGNPYPSPISINDFMATNASNIENTLYFWRKSGSANLSNTASGYATYSSLGFTSADASINNVVPTHIHAGQGFFVVARSAGDSNLVFNNNMRGTANSTFYRSSNETSTAMHRFWLNLSNENVVVGQTLVGYMSGATEEVDSGVDALYFNDSAVALTSLINDSEYIIQGRSLPFSDTDIVPLGFKTDVAGNFTISLFNFDGLFAGDQAIYLRDNTTGVVHNLKSSDYSFTTPAGIFNTRFEVLYSTTLGTNNPALTHNTILVGVKDQIIQINAGNVTMEKIELIDVSGRVIYTQDGVNATTATLDQVVANNQMLIVRIHTKESGIVTQKIIF